MRAATALLLVFLAPVALAQPCDPATTDEACPDTTDWHRYFPLDVGNVWQYEDARFTGEPVTFSSWAITGEADVGGQTYVEFERCDESTDGSAICDDPLLLRYDDEHELILRRTDDGDVWWEELPCSFGAPFNTGTVLGNSEVCTGPAEGFQYWALEGIYGATVGVPPDELAGDTRKNFAMSPGTGPEMYAGLGVTQYFYDLVAEPMRLVYAHVGGEQVGTPAFASCDPQDMDEESEVACPDTTDWRSYYPLEVGNQWQYVLDSFLGEEDTYFGTKIFDSEEIEGEQYFLLRRCDRSGNGSTCGRDIWVRYDERIRGLLERREVDGDVYYFDYMADLGSPFLLTPPAIYGEYGYSFDLGPGPTVVGTLKGFFGIGNASDFLSGIGPIRSDIEASPDEIQIVYARIGGVEYGTSAFGFPTPNEPEGAQPVATGFTAAFPNPARGAMQAEYTLADPQTVTMELIDLLGRCVRETELGPQAAGPHGVRLDLGGLRPGLYVLRLSGDAGAEATRRVIVVR